MKHEWRKHEKELYLPKSLPQIVNVPEFSFITVSGSGNPNNNEDFRKKIEALYTLSYAIKMSPRKGIVTENYFEYTVYPLEGVWTLAEEGKYLKVLNKDLLIYKIMIRQPDFVTEDLFEYSLNLAERKLDKNLLDKVTFEKISEGTSLQIMHNGSFDSEWESFAVMDRFLNDNFLQRRSHGHREIYLSNFNRIAEDKLKTVLRYSIEG